MTNSNEHPSTDLDSSTADPYRWLEDIESASALQWAQARNSELTTQLAQGARFNELYTDLLAALDAEGRIPYITRRGGYFYNFWVDREHPQGLWRRTTAQQYRGRDPEWEVLLDLDALSSEDQTTWVWGGARVLQPSLQRALVFLSPGGSDARIMREFDLTTGQFVEDGFRLPLARQHAVWFDENTLLVGTDLGAASMTESGYPRTVRRWSRGTDVGDAPIVFTSAHDEIGPVASVDHHPGFERSFLINRIDFYRSHSFLLREDGALTKLDLPDDADFDLHRQWLTVRLRTQWSTTDRIFRAGALLVCEFDTFLTNKHVWHVVFTPDDHQFLDEHVWTRNRLLLTVLCDVRSRIFVVNPETGWSIEQLMLDGEFDSHEITGTQDHVDDDFLINSSGYLQPATLWQANALDPGGAINNSSADSPDRPPLVDEDGQGSHWIRKNAPELFPSGGQSVRQFFAHSSDGTAIPYFVVGGPSAAPTLLTGYGGFEVPLLPGYSGVIGKGWLSRGGTYVVANIRGGGEYGPAWHSAVQRRQRLKVYEDMAAVAKDLVNREITTAAQLGVEGGSNGGLLAGVMLTRYPELFGAVVSQVPLLDMLRYHDLLAGASWIAEYGDPRDRVERDYLAQYSPYHNVHRDRHYPPVLFTTSTKDDRVHPGHARKMVALMRDQGHDVHYFENIEGGHGGAADNVQRAKKWAMVFEFLWSRLGNSH